MGFACCQLGGGPFSLSDAVLEDIKAARVKYDVEVASYWCGLRGPQVWDFYDGQLTLGLVPAAFREGRVRDLVEAARIGKSLGIKHIITHCGYIPENPLSEVYHDIVMVLRYICGIYKNEGLTFCFETGQETPVTLLRLIEDVGTGNLGVNLDPANLLVYGKANPVDALDIIGKYVCCLHAKDGEYPVNGRSLGVEKPIGKGRVNFPALMAKLKELGFDGAVIIEREIPEGPEQYKDILDAKAILEKLA
jgi:sugar phosphate isomerase/epimerase